MKYVPPLRGGENDPFVNFNPAQGIDGSIVPAEAIEHPQREIVNAITAMGLTPDPRQLDQLAKALLSLRLVFISPEDYEALGPEKNSNNVPYILWREVGGGNSLTLLVIMLNGEKYKFPGLQTLTEPKTWYVNAATGDDANDGETAGTAFRTVQRAVNHVTRNFIFVNASGTISVAAGTYVENVDLLKFAYVGEASMRLIGAGRTLTTINGTVYGRGNGCHWSVAGIRILISTAISGNAFATGYLSHVTFGDFIVQATVAVPIAMVQAYNPGTFLTLRPPITLIATTASRAIAAAGLATVIIESAGDVNITGTYTEAVVVAGYGSLVEAMDTNTTFSGSPTGKRFAAYTGAGIVTNGRGANLFPGTVAGTVASSGWTT